MSSDEATRQASREVTQRNQLSTVYDSLNNKDKSEFSRKIATELGYEGQKRDAYKFNKNDVGGLGEGSVAKALGLRASAEQQTGLLTKEVEKIYNLLTGSEIGKTLTASLQAIFKDSTSHLETAYTTATDAITKAKERGIVLENPTFNISDAKNISVTGETVKVSEGVKKDLKTSSIRPGFNAGELPTAFA